jgi:hypothetical protein
MRLRLPFATVLLFIVQTVSGQVELTYPFPRAVFQRSALNQATIPIAGSYTLPIDRLEVRTKSVGTPSTTSRWQLLQDKPQNGVFAGTLTLPGGWYQLEVRGLRRDTIVALTSLERVGVGEVFLIAGQSQAMGLPNLGAKGASDWVSVMDRLNKRYDEQESLTISPDQPTPVPLFSRPTAESNVYPTGETPWLWGELGDRLAERLRVPVLFFNAAWAATTAENWSQSADGKAAFNMYVGKYWANQQPYANFRNVLQSYHRQFGLRAVLWLHGESDASHVKSSAVAYQKYLQNLIDRTRQHAGYAMPWVVANSSMTVSQGGPYTPVRDAQRALTEVPGNGVFLGPDADQIQNPRPAHGHFENVSGGVQGLTLAAQAWNASLTDDFFKQAVPRAATGFVQTGLVPRVALPGARFRLTFESTLREATVFYTAELMDEKGEFLAEVGLGAQSPLTVQLPATLLPGTYQLRVRANNPGLPGAPSTPFTVTDQTTRATPLAGFQATALGRRVLAGWSVIPEVNTQEFVLQRSQDRGTYADVLRLSATPDGRTSRFYAATDPNPPTGFSHYRLKVVLRDGSSSYFGLQTVFVDADPTQVNVFPNPSYGQPIYVKLPGVGAYRAQLYDVRGNAVSVALSEPGIGGVYELHPATSLAQGIYWLKIVSDGAVYQRKIVITGSKSVF